MRTSTSRPEPEEIRAEIAARAGELGFAAFGIVRAESGAERQALEAFLAQGYHGDMDWMERNRERRGDPRELWPEARSIVMLGAPYTPGTRPGDLPADPARGAVSVYAQGRDYHTILKKALKRLAGEIAARFGGEVKIFVDTAPVMEKPLAARAGLGWQGKHSNLVSRSHGSWLFLGEIFTSLDLPPDAPAEDRCGSCRACLDSCPTAAFPAPYRLDARRCVSYLTIEHKGPIAREFRAAMGNRIYGCDDCLAACPWNKFADAAANRAFPQRAELAAPALAELAELDDAAFRARFAGTAIKRTGRDRMVRNVLIAIGNSGDTALAAAAERRLADASPLVRAMAAWALSQLLPPARFAALRARHLPAEEDAEVRAEWDLTRS
jgi:epoxyqueuosine reductase